jgi:hypothetical protein
MKTHVKLLTGTALAAVLSAPAFGQTATTKPVGYRTETLAAGVISLLAPNLSDKIGAAGTIESAAGTTLTDNEGNFNTAFPTAGTKLVFQITAGANAGVLAEATVASNTTITTTQDISGLVPAGTQYELRAADTINLLFGPNNEAGLGAGTAATADLIYVLNSTGGFDVIFRSDGGLTGVGWRRIGGGATDAGNTTVFATDAIFIHNKGAAPKDIVFVGHVRTVAPIVGLETNFNYLSRWWPVGVQLDESGLQPVLTAGTADTADKVFVPDGAGGYRVYFVSAGGLIGAGWRQVGQGAADKANDELSSGFIVERKGAATNVTLTEPPGLDI